MALTAVAPSAFGVVTATPTPAGTTRGIPQFVLTSSLGVGTQIHWTIVGPTGTVDDDTGPSPVTIIRDPLADGSHTLNATDGVDPPLLIGTFIVDTIAPPVGVVTAGPPAITGIVSPLNFQWTRPADGATSHWQLFDSSAGLVAEATTAATQVAVTPKLPDGDRILRFQVSNLDAVGNPSAFSAPYVFNVDQTPPGQPLLTAAPPVLTRIRTPSFTWQGAQAGGSFEWDVTEAGKSVLGPGAPRTTTDTSITNVVLPISSTVNHSLVFRVRQIDPYGNRGAELTYSFTIVRPLIPPPPTRLAKYMSPKAGAVGTSLQPLLSWRRLYGGTSFYNVKILQGQRKVFSAFPVRNKIKVPKGKLKRGVLYTWFVFSYIGKRKAFIELPMTSYFTTRP